jgi:hypothetical protein
MKILFFFCCFVVLSLLVVAPQTAAQVKPLIENDQVKIYEATIKVGVKTLEHRSRRRGNLRPQRWQRKGYASRWNYEDQ